ncbi:MAG: hypothetical protein M3Z57_01315 [Candidatus Dormibacteraeota bacterium]|nr:hypothetical protein [Candidatus Dormibacteraeota bacterium]
MATPTDPLDSQAVMSYGGLVDPSTATGQVDEESDSQGTVAALLTATAPADTRERATRKPAAHMAHITRRRGAYSPKR